MTSSRDNAEQSAERSANTISSSSNQSDLHRPELKGLLNEDDEMIHRLREGETEDSTETGFRYAAYTRTLRTFMGTAQRYIAYSSDIGESFRPVSHPYLVRSAYAISWAYILGDVTIEGRKAFLAHQDYILRHSPHLKTVSEPHCDATVQPDTSEAAKRNDPGQLTPWPTAHVPLSQDWRSITAERAVFQVFASMALPAFTIHSIVKYSGRAVKDSKSVFMRTWAPIGLGLSIVPVLPFIFDRPVEHLVRSGFNALYHSMAGQDAFPTDDSDTVRGDASRPLSESKKQR